MICDNCSHADHCEVRSRFGEYAERCGFFKSAKQLKSCPFCGGEACLRLAIEKKSKGKRLYISIGRMNGKYSNFEEVFHKHYQVQCLDCQNSTPLCGTIECAVNGWNRRIENEV